jgi:hypothetical protein
VGRLVRSHPRSEFFERVGAIVYFHENGHVERTTMLDASLFEDHYKRGELSGENVFLRGDRLGNFSGSTATMVGNRDCTSTAGSWMRRTSSWLVSTQSTKFGTGLEI